jgi:hypothetical protein
VIRFSAGLVVVAIGILVGGVATSKLLLVYVAIAVSAAALVALAIGVVLKREELFGEQLRTSADVAAADMRAGATTGEPALVGQAAAGAAAVAQAGPSSDRAGQSAFGQHAYGQPGAVGQGSGAATAQAGAWPAWGADSRPTPASPPGARQSPPPPAPFGTPRTEDTPAAARASGQNAAPGAWYQEPG